MGKMQLGKQVGVWMFVDETSLAEIILVKMSGYHFSIRANQ